VITGQQVGEEIRSREPKWKSALGKRKKCKGEREKESVVEEGQLVKSGGKGGKKKTGEGPGGKTDKKKESKRGSGKASKKNL